MTQSTDVLKQTPGRKIGPYRADQVGSLLRSEPVKKRASKKRTAKLALNNCAKSKTKRLSALSKSKKKLVLKPSQTGNSAGHGGISIFLKDLTA